jgi:poly(3-hydroxyalkanoate) synthetase
MSRYSPDTPPELMPTRLPERLGEHGVETWHVVAEGVLDYLDSAIQRGTGPVEMAADLLRWFEVASLRQPPAWATPNEIVLETPVARLRDFSDPDATEVVPTLIFPPQAGHDSCIVDYSADQSQVGVIKAAGLRRLYSLDWVGASPETKDLGINDYVAVIDRAVEHIGGPVNVIGDCQGGWLATIWAELHPEVVHTLTIAGAPIDFHAGEPVIHDYVRFFSPTEDMHFYESIVALGGGVMKGEFMVNGFILMRPESEIERQLELLAHIHDADHVERYSHFEDWFKHTQDIPGGFYLWIVEHLFRDNELILGKLKLGGRRVDLKSLRAPLFLLAGAKDHITPPDQVFALADYTTTPESEVRRRTTTGGHLGLFMGHSALRDHWPPLMAEVYERSTLAAPR